jgi:hypothetical protein
MGRTCSYASAGVCIVGSDPSVWISEHTVMLLATSWRITLLQQEALPDVSKANETSMRLHSIPWKNAHSKPKMALRQQCIRSPDTHVRSDQAWAALREIHTHGWDRLIQPARSLSEALTTCLRGFYQQAFFSDIVISVRRATGVLQRKSSKLPCGNQVR